MRMVAVLALAFVVAGCTAAPGAPLATQDIPPVQAEHSGAAATMSADGKSSSAPTPAAPPSQAPSHEWVQTFNLTMTDLRAPTKELVTDDACLGVNATALDQLEFQLAWSPQSPLTETLAPLLVLDDQSIDVPAGASPLVIVVPHHSSGVGLVLRAGGAAASASYQQPVQVTAHAISQQEHPPAVAGYCMWYWG